MAKSRTIAPERNFLDRIDCIIEIYKEKNPYNGEDAYVYALNDCAVMVGVFDGCGGAGAKRHAKLQGKTGAYLASRIVSGTVKDWFAEFNGNDTEEPENTIKQKIVQNLQMCHSIAGEESKLLSPMVKVFPTTAAFAYCSEDRGKMSVDYFWAGDSRVYLLDCDGLAQLSVDDLSVPDAMENLYDDGVMTNVISKSKDFSIHHHRISLEKPGIIFAATDGCFGYVSSPMEFEYMLIESMLASQNVEEWELNLSERIGRVAGDDYTMSGVALDYGSFSEMRTSFIDRGNELYREYISGIKELSREQKTMLWNRFKGTYNRFL